MSSQDPDTTNPDNTTAAKLSDNPDQLDDQPIAERLTRNRTSILATTLAIALTIGFFAGLLGPTAWHWYLDQSITPGHGTIIGGFFIVTAAAIAYTGTHLTRTSTERIADQKNTLETATAKRTHDLADTQELRRRFVTTTAQFADPSPEVRLAGVYALEALTNDWIDRDKHTDAQTCINYLCGYLTRPYTPPTHDPHLRQTVVTPDIGTHIQRTYHHPHDDLNVRQAITRTIATHLKPDNQHNWSTYNYDLTGAHFHNADFTRTHFRGTADFTKAKFHGERTSFDEAEFHGERTSFGRAEFHGERTSFNGTQFHGERTSFFWANFHSKQRTSFDLAGFHGERTSFDLAEFYGEVTSFDWTQFHDEHTSFDATQFHGERTLFGRAEFHSKQLTSFIRTQFHGERTSFEEAEFHGKRASFRRAVFRSKRTSFDWAKFHGEATTFDRVQFRGELTSFDSPKAWNNVYFDWDPKIPFAVTKSKPDSVTPHQWPPTVTARTP